MPRSFRFIQKKRGDRRTGSHQLGAAGQAFLFASFLLGGGVSLGLTIANHTIPEWRINHDYVPHACRVLGKRVVEVPDERGGFRPELWLQFALGKDEYATWGYDGGGLVTADRERCEQRLAEFEVGREYACWYDPLDPNQAVLVRDYTLAAWLRLLLPIPFLVVGGGGLAFVVVNWGKSAERRVVLARRTAQLDLLQTGESADHAFPTLPADTAIINSPGTRLRYRLPPVRPGWRLWSLVAASIVWNGVLAVLIVMTLNSAVGGGSHLVLAAFMLPFLAAGGWMAAVLVRKMVQAMRVGPTVVEISTHPWRPAGRFEVFASQAGRLRLDVWRLALVCEEEATFSQGTNKRTESRRVFEQELFRRDNVDLDAAGILEHQCEIVTPAAAMHSFESAHNKIRWQLVVTGQAGPKTGFERAFLVHFHPLARVGDR